jgi:hypothetical protein
MHRAFKEMEAAGSQLVLELELESSAAKQLVAECKRSQQAPNNCTLMKHSGHNVSQACSKMRLCIVTSISLGQSRMGR